MTFRLLLTAAVVAGTFVAGGMAGAEAGPATTGPINARITGDIVPTHDPVLVKEKGTYTICGRPPPCKAVAVI